MKWHALSLICALQPQLTFQSINNNICTNVNISSIQGVLETTKFFFRFKPKQTKTQSVSVVFRFVSRNQKTFFSVCFGVSDRYRNNRNKQYFVKTNRKNLLLGGPRNNYFFFLGLNRNKPKLNLFGCFLFYLLRNQKICFRFVSVFRTGIETTETNRTYGMGN